MKLFTTFSSCSPFFPVPVPYCSPTAFSCFLILFLSVFISADKDSCDWSRLWRTINSTGMDCTKPMRNLGLKWVNMSLSLQSGVTYTVKIRKSGYHICLFFFFYQKYQQNKFIRVQQCKVRVKSVNYSVEGQLGWMHGIICCLKLL